MFGGDLQRSEGALSTFLPWTHKGFQRTLSASVSLLSSSSENYLCSWLVGSQTCGGCPPFWNLPSPPSSMSIKARLLRLQEGGAHGSRGRQVLAWFALGGSRCKDTARPLLGRPHRPPLSPAYFPRQKQAFPAPLTP